MFSFWYTKKNGKGYFMSGEQGREKAYLEDSLICTCTYHNRDDHLSPGLWLKCKGFKALVLSEGFLGEQLH